MKLVAILSLLACSSAHAWNVSGLAYYDNPYQPPAQQEQPQPTYSQQYNTGCMDGYLNAHGYESSNGYGSAYSDGYRAARPQQ